MILGRRAQSPGRRRSSTRRALKLVGRCSIDHPELASVWFEQGREARSPGRKRVLEGSRPVKRDELDPDPEHPRVLAAMKDLLTDAPGILGP